MIHIQERIDSYIRENRQALVELAVELSRIPSWTGNEAAKAAFILDYLHRSCGVEGWQDDAGNVLYLHETANDNPLIVYCAHIDTVFDNIENIEVTYDGDLIYAPSILDNSINAAALLFAIGMLNTIDVPLGKNILFAFSVGEEGLGNLRGVRQLVDDRCGAIDEFVAVDLGYTALSITAVGSKRFKVEVKSAGGHGWRDFGSSSAIASAAGIIQEIYLLNVPDHPKTTYNIGLVSGGTSVNSVAGDCTFFASFRSEDQEQLDKLVCRFESILEKFRNEAVSVTSTSVGERPCGNISPRSPLVRKIAAVREMLGMDTPFCANSTDANYPMSLGIPAVTTGVCNGGGVHSQDEYLDTSSLDRGITAFLYFLAGLYPKRGEGTDG